MSRHLSTRNISSKSMHAFLNNLANRQTDRQTRANAFTSCFVGGKDVHTKCQQRNGNVIATRTIICTLTHLFITVSMSSFWLCIYLVPQTSNTVLASSGGCKPRSVSVALRPLVDDDPNAFYFPSCTDVMQCSGCCDYPPHACMAISIDTVHRQVTPL